MKSMKKIIFLIIILVLCLITIVVFFRRPNLRPVKAQLDHLDLSGYNKLMIISHPTDELLWGGVHLQEDNYLIVCVSCGVNETRDLSFIRGINETNDIFLMMGYPDNFYLKRDLNKINKKLKMILEYKNWDEVITHNPDGEYGNLQHKLLSKEIKRLVPLDNLYYFGKYYDKKDLNLLDKETKLNSNLLKNKYDILKNYDDYRDLQKKYGHMYPFEDWTRGSEWKS